MGTLLVRLTPRGGRDVIEGVDDDGRLRARVAAPPVDGAANEALIRLLATTLGVPRGALTITGGATSRVKRVTIEGDPAALRARLAALWPGIAPRD